MKLSIVIAFYNMQREAPRTLFSASAKYQTGTENIEYEVIAVDNASSRPLPADIAASFGSNFKQLFYESQHPSPCEAINSAVRSAKSEYVMCCIDGARILSPGIIRKTITIAEAYKHPFIYTLGMHIGGKVQNQSMLEGYNQETEDALLATVDWQNNGYDLFTISSVALSSKQGFFSNITESNCFTMLREDYLAMGGFNESFTSPGGGICNLDIFKRANEYSKMTPIMLFGEATFHQYHNGVATNVTRENHPIKSMMQEYKRIYDTEYKPSCRPPVYFGDISAQAIRFTHSPAILSQNC